MPANLAFSQSSGIVRAPAYPMDACSPATSSCVTTLTSPLDRKSTRLNSSHITISYAVFCLKKKKLHDQVRHYNHSSKSDRTQIGYQKKWSFFCPVWYAPC